MYDKIDSLYSAERGDGHLNILQSILYGLISGLAAFLPISLPGHQSLLNLLFGVRTAEPIRDLLVHISIIFAVVFSSSTYLSKLRREMNLTSHTRRKNRYTPSSFAYDIRLIQSSILPMIITFVILMLFKIESNSFAVLAVFFLLNGIVIYITEHIPRGNKDSSKLSALDGLLAGVCSALCVLPGISRVGAAMSCFLVRGADRGKALNWILLITIPVCLMLIIFDFITLFTVGIGAIRFVTFLGYVISAITTFVAAFGGIYLMRYMSVHIGFSVFAFYSWGAAILSFILYLSI